MRYKSDITGAKIYLKQFEIEDCTEAYLNWFNDPVINQFISTKWEKQTIDNMRKYAQNVISSNDTYLFKIIFKENGAHIGNIKLGPIDKNNNLAFISYIIGEKQYWGQGIATEAISLIVGLAFDTFAINRLWTGLYESNLASLKALQNNGFVVEGRQRKALSISNNEFEDHILVGLLKEEHQAVL